MGAWAIVLAFLCFIGSMAVPVIARTWRSYLIVVGVAVLFFAWMTLEVHRPGTIPSGIGAFLGGLMLTGFAFGAIARFVMLLGQPKDDGGADPSPPTGRHPRA